jgi:hypothetical protein
VKQEAHTPNWFPELFPHQQCQPRQTDSQSRCFNHTRRLITNRVQIDFLYRRRIKNFIWTMPGWDGGNFIIKGRKEGLAYD